MESYIKLLKHKDSNTIVVSFQNENDKPFRIGERMNEIHPEAYMNGYNWDAFLNYYLSKHYPDILTNMESDPEAGSYAAYYRATDENQKRAEELIKVIINLIENEDKIYNILRNEAGNIEWD